MKADPAAQQTLLELQGVDLSLDQAAHRRRTLPELAELAAITAETTELDRERIGAETTLSDLQRDQKKADADVEQVKARRSRDQQRLDSGAVPPAQLQSLVSEIESLNKRISDLEDVELEVMEKLETAENDVERLRVRLAELAERSGGLGQTRDAAFAEIDELAAALRQQRDGLAATLPADLLGLYDKQRERHGGIGAAEFSSGRCGGCRMELDAIAVRDLEAMPADQVARCDECSRILIRR